MTQTNPRVILFSGKGGVGKTTIAAATGLAAAKRGAKTIVMSFDLAHSLSDAFDLDRDLFELNEGRPLSVVENLEIQEIDVQAELDRHWGDIASYMMLLMSSTGLKDVVSEEMAILPGMEDIVALLYLNQYVSEGAYDAIILDCPPTSEALRFVNLTSMLQWYMRKRFRFDRNLLKIAGPLASKFVDLDLPEDSHFAALKRLYDQLEGIDELLLDSQQTTVRLVTNPERMVVRETQRAYMFFNMYGVTTDAVVVNRVIEEADGPFATWADTHAKYVAQVREYFAPLPVFKVPLYGDEVLGIGSLTRVAELLYHSDDPCGFQREEPPYEIVKNGSDRYTLRVKLPFATKQKVKLSRKEGDLIIRVGTFKRYVPLPRGVARLETAEASITDGNLLVEFR